MVKGTDSRIFPSWSTSESPQNKGLTDKREEVTVSVNTLSAVQIVPVKTFVNERRLLPAASEKLQRFVTGGLLIIVL